MHKLHWLHFLLLLTSSNAYDSAVEVTDAASFVQIESRLKKGGHVQKDASTEKEGPEFDPSMMPPPSWFIGPKDDSNDTAATGGDRKDDLVFLHMPYNFGNTIEKVAMFPHSASRIEVLKYVMSFSGGTSFASSDATHIPSWEKVNNLTQPGGTVWGHFNPDLLSKSTITGCPLYLTPPKHWPVDVAQKYFGNKKIFGVLRDPYEKLVAQFRGHMADYGGSATEKTLKECDVNDAVKELLKKMDTSGDMTTGGCVNIPQSEYFEGDFGIQIAVDNWRFPKSANELFEEHGYPWHIQKEDVIHVWKCPDKWSADFDDETRGLIRKVYAKDFDLICKKFGHCDFDQDTCIQGVHTMCPSTVFKWDDEKELYCPAEGIDTKNIRVRQECLASAGSSEADAEKSGARSMDLTSIMSLVGMVTGLNLMLSII